METMSVVRIVFLVPFVFSVPVVSRPGYLRQNVPWVISFNPIFIESFWSGVPGAQVFESDYDDSFKGRGVTTIESKKGVRPLGFTSLGGEGGECGRDVARGSDVLLHYLGNAAKLGLPSKAKARESEKSVQMLNQANAHLGIAEDRAKVELPFSQQQRLHSLAEEEKSSRQQEVDVRKTEVSPLSPQQEVNHNKLIRPFSYPSSYPEINQPTTPPAENHTRGAVVSEEDAAVEKQRISVEKDSNEEQNQIRHLK